MSAFSQLTAFGLSVRGVRCSAGWGTDQLSTLELELVQDPKHGDSPAFPPVGTPAYFQFFGLTFNGLFQKLNEKRDPSGDPVFDAIVTDPRTILAGTQLILGAYNGASVIPNVLNVFGYYENVLGFGASGANESGMPWSNVLQGIYDLCNGPSQTPYGGPLQWNGVSYSLDLSQLPITPPFYRVGGVTANLLEVIAQVCTDGACDFFVDLVGYTIRVRTVSRLKQPPLGTITALTTADTGTDLMRAEAGVEARSDNVPNSVLLLGGDVTNLHLSENIVSFWGYDINGNPITGTPATFTFKDTNNKDLSTVACETMTLNAEGVADIVAAVGYSCNTVELRLAMESYESWSAYITAYRQDISNLIFSPFKNPGGAGAAVKPKLINDDRDQALKLAKNALTSDFHVKQQRLYEFVRRHGEDYYGKQFLVGIPFVLVKEDAETLFVTYSLQPTDAAWYSEDLPPLSLPELKADVLRVEDGRYRCFVEFDLDPNKPQNLGLDFARIPAAETVVGGTNLYMLSQVSGGIVLNPTPYVLVSLPGAVYEKASDFLGGLDIINGVLQGVDEDKINKMALGNIGLKCWPAAHYPTTVAIPLKSNVLTYGPWFASGAQGPAAVEHDPTLVPWNYGGEAAMELAAQQRVQNAFSNMTVCEAGLVELAGPPAFSLGDVLQSNGPNITNIAVAFGPQGVTTTYRMQTFTPRFGVFTKFTSERLRKLGLVNQQLKRALRQVINQDIERAETVNTATKAALRGFMQNAPKALKRQSPHETILSFSFQEANGDIRVGVSSATFEETLAGIADCIDATQPNDGSYLASAAMGLAGIVRPYAVTTGSNMPHLEPPIADFSGTGLNSSTLNPLQPNNDIEVYTWGSNYAGLHAYRRGASSDARAMALRGPLMLEGWGFDMNGSPIPSQDGVSFFSNYLKRSDLWAVGPMDPYWDPSRGVWTSHDIVQGYLSGPLAPGATALLTVYKGGISTSLSLEVTNYSSQTIPCGKVGAGFLAHSMTWAVFPLGPQSFWGRITAQLGGNVYAILEVDDYDPPSPPEEFQPSPNGVVTTQAEEVNGQGGVPVGTIVRVWPNPQKCGWYGFSYLGGITSSSSSSSASGGVKAGCTSYEVVTYAACEDGTFVADVKCLNIPNGLGITLTDSPTC